MNILKKTSFDIILSMVYVHLKWVSAEFISFIIGTSNEKCTKKIVNNILYMSFYWIINKIKSAIFLHPSLCHTHNRSVIRREKHQFENLTKIDKNIMELGVYRKH